MRGCALGLMVLLAACQSIGIEAVSDRAADLGRYRTFSWAATHPLVVAGPQTVDPALEARMVTIARDTLVAKGFELAPDPAQADFLLGFTIGVVAAADAAGYPEDLRARLTLDAGPLAGRPDFARGLTVNIYDAAARAPVWRGSVRNVALVRGTVDRSRLRRAIEAALARFPPR